MNEPLKSVYSADLKMGTLTLKCHVLNNGQRIIEEESMRRFIEWLGTEELLQSDADEFTKNLKNLGK